MTYALAAPLQAAIYSRLTSDPALTDVQVFDATPAGAVSAVHVVLGAEDVRDRSDKTGRAAQHRFVLTVAGDGGGFHRLKEVAGAVEAALHAMLPLSRGRVAFMRFERAVARRDRDGTRRRVEMTFRALLDDN
jgi:hypothetical protein